MVSTKLIVGLVAFVCCVLASQASAQAPLVNLINATWTDYSATIRNFEGVRNYFVQSKDHRGVFTTAYNLVNHNLDSALGSSIRRPAWLRSVMVSFLEKYRFALYSYVKGDMGSCPQTWAIAFRSNSKNLHSMADLLTGMISHIVYDLPRALAESIDRDPSDVQIKQADYAMVGEILSSITGEIMDAIEDDYPYGMYYVFKYGAIASKDVLLPIFRNAAWRYATDVSYRRSRDVASDAAKLSTMVDNSFTVIKNGGDLLSTVEDLMSQMMDTIKRLFGSGKGDFVTEEHIRILENIGVMLKHAEFLRDESKRQ
jgi:hypothetical protein